MSSQPVTLFRQSWRMLLLAVSLLMLSILGLAYLQSLGQQQLDSWAGLDWTRLGQSLSQSWLMVLLISGILPWLMLSFAGEWLYTRSLRRQELFKLIWREYLKWWGIPALLLLGLTLFSHLIRYDSGREIPWELTGFSISICLFGTLVFSANYAILRRLLGPALLLLGWILFGNDLSWQRLPLGHWLGWAGWLLLLSWTYLQVAGLKSELSLARMGNEDDENQALERLKLFQSLGALKPLKLQRFSRLGAKLAQLQLLTSHTRMLYAQLLLVMLAGVWVIELLQLHHAGWNLSVYGTGIIGSVSLLCSCVLLMVIAIPPRFLLARRWEFLASRPLPPAINYLANWCLQGLVMLVLSLLIYALMSQIELLAQLLNPGALAYLFVLFWLGGELTILLLCLLSAASVGLAPALLIGWLAMVHSQDWPALGFLALLLGFRVWDFWRFCQGFEPAQSPVKALKRQLLHYAGPLSASLLLVWFGMQSQPLARFLSYPQSTGVSLYTSWMTGVQTGLAIYTSKPNASGLHENQALDELFYTEQLRALIARPHDPEAALDLAEAFIAVEGSLEDLESWRPYQLSSGRQPAAREDLYLSSAYWLSAGKQANPQRQLKLQLRLAELRGDYARIRQLAQQLQPLEPDSAFARARAEHVLLRYQQAYQAYLKLAEDPQQAEKALQAAANVAIEAGRFEQAIPLLIRALSYLPERLDQNKTLYRLVTLPYYRLGLCPELEQVMQAAQGQRWLSAYGQNLLSQQALCHDRPLPDTPPAQLALWYLRTGQAAKAAELYQQLNSQSLALALLAQGRSAEARRQAKQRAEAWNPGNWSSRVYLLSYYPDNQYMLHRVLLETEPEPSWDSALQVLFRSRQPDKDWPLLQKAFASRPQALLRLKTYRQQLDRLYKAYEVQGMFHAADWRSLSSTRVMLELFEPQSAADPGLRAAIQDLRQVMGLS